MKEKHKKQIEADIKRINSALENINPDIPKAADGLIAAQKHSLLAGGKRIRPLLVLAFSRLFGGSDKAAMPFATAVEMIHTASLIHDDMPSLDNDTLRRGMPTCHVKFGEATALLAADGLFMDAFGVVAKNPYTTPDKTLLAVRVLSEATGTGGLVGGEYADVMGEGRALPLEEMKLMHSCKTGALIKASARLGAIAAGISADDERMKSTDLYAENIGLAFQIVDDVLDATGTSESLGKNPGKDKTAEKSTYLNYYTPKAATELARSLTDAAVAEISKYEGSDFLIDLAKDLSERQN